LTCYDPKCRLAEESALNSKNDYDSVSAHPHLPRILIVEDNPSIARALAEVLRKQEYETIVSLRGLDALEQARRVRFDAAVIDVHLPDMNGLVLSQKLREQLGPDAPIIVLSGDTSMETLNSLSFVGATYFFSKPVNSERLIERLRQCAPNLSGGKNDVTSDVGQSIQPPTR